MSLRKLSIGDTVLHFKYEIEDDMKMKYMYRITGFATHTETGENLVIYRSMWSGQYFARPMEMFLSEVDHDKYPDVRQKFRFEILENT